MQLKDIYLYRITHIENIPHVLLHGITHRNSPYRNDQFVSIGDTSLIGFRTTKTLKIRDAEITLGDFIPFYFGTRMPMLYVIQHGYNFASHTKPDDIVYMVVPLAKFIADDNRTLYFTDGHATEYITKGYDRSDIDDLPGIIDWNAVQATKWSGEGVETDMKRRKQAEFLTDKDIPYSFIHSFGCYNEYAKSKLEKFGIDSSLITIVPNAYY